MTTAKSEPPSCELGVARLRRPLSPAERQNYEAHLAKCQDCRLLAQLHLDLNPLGDVVPGDDAVIAEAMRVSMARLSGTRAPRRRRALPSLLVAMLWVSASAGAVLAGRQIWELVVPASEPHLQGSVLSRSKRSRGFSRVTASERNAVNPAPASAAPEPPLARSSVPPVFSARTALIRTPEPSSLHAVAALPSAAAQVTSDLPSSAHQQQPLADAPAPTLLAAAMAARASGDRALALDLFQQLQQRFPNSNEASVALISAGQLQLANSNPVAALAAFNGYRSRVPRGALSEEALVGSARALAQLQRFEQELEVWRELLTRFPNSAYRARAQGRLSQSSE